MDCQDNATPDPVDLLRDDAESSRLATLTLEIEAFEERVGGFHLCLAAQVDEQRVGFAVLVRPSARPGLRLAAHELELPRCEVQIDSTGAESDRFVAAVAAVYGLATAGRMLDELCFDALCLAGDPTRPQLGPVQLVLMYAGAEPARRGQGFQWFLRIDLTQGEVGFLDRAPEGQAAIVAALSGEPRWRH